MSNAKPTLATVWLDGCSGCHMSFLDMDDRLLALAEQADLVYSPLVDRKDFPDQVDITLGGRLGLKRGRSRENQKGPRAHQDSGLARRLRRHQQRSRHAQSLRRQAGPRRAFTSTP